MLIEASLETNVEPEEAITAEPTCLIILEDNKLRRLAPKFVTAEFLMQEKPLYVFNTATDRSLRLFTSKGACLTIPIGDIPETKAAAKPTNLSAIVQLEKDEAILAAFEEDFTIGRIFFYTSNGLVKSTEATEYVTKTKRIVAVNIKEDDSLLSVEYVKEPSDSILLVSERGMSIRFESDSVPVTGRASAGVKGIKLDDGDKVVHAQHVPEEGEILIVTDRGYMKRSFVFDHDIQGRNGKGLQCFGFKKNGSNGTRIAAVVHVKEPMELVAVQLHGDETSFNTEEVRIEQRAGKGQPMVMVLMDNIVNKVIKK